VKLRHARYFLAVAEERNFTRAAEKLGARLSQCVAHCAELTKVGETFLIETQTILAGTERANVAGQRAHRGQSGMLLLGLSGSAAFNLLLLARYGGLHPSRSGGYRRRAVAPRQKHIGPASGRSRRLVRCGRAAATRAERVHLVHYSCTAECGDGDRRSAVGTASTDATSKRQ